MTEFEDLRKNMEDFSENKPEEVNGVKYDLEENDQKGDEKEEENGAKEEEMGEEVRKVMGELDDGTERSEGEKSGELAEEEENDQEKVKEDEIAEEDIIELRPSLSLKMAFKSTALEVARAIRPEDLAEDGGDEAEDGGELGEAEEEAVDVTRNKERPYVQIRSQRSFRAFLKYGDPHYQPSKKQAPIVHKRAPLTTKCAMSKEQARTYALSLIDNRKKIPTDQDVIVDVIDQLEDMEVELLEGGEYKKSLQCKDMIQALMNEYRKAESNKIYSDTVSKAAARHRKAAEEHSAAVSKWKNTIIDTKIESKSELQQLEEKQNAAQEELRNLFVDEKTIRKYRKKSSFLLQMEAIEHYLVQIGQFETADEFKRSNKLHHNSEIKVRQKQMQLAYSKARDNLSDQQQKELENLLAYQEFRSRMIAEQQSTDLMIKARRQDLTKQILADYKDYNNFLAKKFKTSPGKVLPLTVSIKGGGDVPTKKEKMINKKEITNMRMSQQISSPLQLPELKIKSMRKKKSV